VFVLEQPGGAWLEAGKLPRPLGYGVSVSTADGVLCLGGSDAKRHYADAFLLRWSNGKLHWRKMPSLPANLLADSGRSADWFLKKCFLQSALRPEFARSPLHPSTPRPCRRHAHAV
jgi:hypothetical protein